MVDVGAVLDLTPLAAPPAPGITRGRSVVGARHAYSAVDLGSQVIDASVTTAGSPPSPGTGGTVFAAIQDPTPGKTWFNMIHLLPRGGIAFGNIITTTQQDFELFNAFGVDVTLSTFVNNAGAGISVPVLTVPRVVGAYTSVLDPASTRLSPQTLYVQADPDGPAQFEGTLDFTFNPGGLVQLLVSGTRIVAVTARYEREPKERLSWFTSILEKQDGTHANRIAERKQPRQSFEVVYRLDGLPRRQMQALLFEWQGRLFAVPVFAEEMRITASVSPGATTITVDSTANVDLRIGGLVALVKSTSASTFDVLEVASFTSTVITVASPVQQSYVAGDVAAPARTCFIKGTVGGNRKPYAVQDFRVVYESTDNNTGITTSFANTGTFPLYAGKVVFDCNTVSGDLSEQYETRVTVVDNETGIVFQDPNWNMNRRIHTVSLRSVTRARHHEIRRMLYALRGRQISFWVATGIEDLVVTQNITSGTALLTVENVGYTKYIASRQPKNVFRITFTDGTFLEREILSSVELSATEERLTVDANWPANKTVAQVSRVEFYEPSCMASDDVEVQHRIGQGRALFTFSAESLNE